MANVLMEFFFFVAIPPAVLAFSIALILRPDKYWRYLVYGHSEEQIRGFASVPQWAFRACGVLLLVAMLAMLGVWLPDLLVSLGAGH
jgi:hypothetical protein